jgi:cytochrome P450
MNVQVIIITVSFIISAIYFLPRVIYFLVIRRRSLRLPNGNILPGPEPEFLTGNAKHVFGERKPHLAFDRYIKEYGNLFQLYFADKTVLFSNDIEVFQSVSKNPSFPFRIATWAHRVAFQDKGIIFSNDEEIHKANRAIGLKGLMKTSVLKQMTSTILEETETFIKEIESKKDKGFEFGSVISLVTFNIISKHFFFCYFEKGTEKNPNFLFNFLFSKAKFGFSLEKQDSSMQTFVYGVMAGLVYWTRKPFAFFRFLEPFKWREWKKKLNEADSYATFLIAERKKQGKSGKEDFLDFLMTETNPVTEQKFSELELIRIINDIISAGHGTFEKKTQKRELKN